MDVLEFVDAKKYFERYLLECRCSKQHCMEQGDLDLAKEFEHQERVLIEMLKQMELEQKATE
ncbi:MAG: hypothetical protein IJ085_01135 [Turicibacter sp.]|nr:hypothetical protein [Turicibacter sp.]